MHVMVTESAEVMADRAGALLRSRIEHNVLATVLEAAGRTAGAAALYAYIEDAHGRVVAAALRTPPHPLLASVMSEEAAEALMSAWIPVDPECSGVVAVPEVARSVAAAWERRTGGTSSLTMAQALHVLDRVIAPARPPAGRLRPARGDERELLVEWSLAFSRESGALIDPEEMVGRRLEQGLLHVWDDDGPVSFLAHNPAVAGVVRIGPVYTPPALRARGYASSAVAALSQAQLDAGARECCLFTDLANPTSNRIYAAVGYRSVAAWEQIGFG